MILIIEDNSIIADNLSEYLELQWIDTKVFYDGETAFEYIVQSQEKGKGIPKWIILDRMMPKLDWLSLARMLKNRGFYIPIIFLTALDKPLDRLEWLEVGAIDYISKPVELKELSLKIQNLLNLSLGNTQKRPNFQEKSPNQYSMENWEAHIQSCNSWRDLLQVDSHITLDRSAKQVTLNWKPISLSPKEYGIFELLALRQWQVVTYDSILENVWHESPERIDVFQGSITVHIAYLRKKIQTSLIRTVKLTGYILDFPKA